MSARLVLSAWRRRQFWWRVRFGASSATAAVMAWLIIRWRRRARFWVSFMLSHVWM